jgi:ubiquinone/menaquinone biosynthesis C-methylase UbiE
MLVSGDAVLSHQNAVPRRPQENAYTSSTWWYDLRGFGILTFSYRDTLGSQIGFFERNLKATHLEVAVGTGTLFKMVLRRRGKNAAALPEKIIGVDYSPEMLEGSKRRFSRSRNVTLMLQDVTCMQFADGTFDSINIANALHCFADVDAALSEVRRVLKPGGTLAVNALLHPRGFFLSRRIAQAINRWGIKKGILYTPFAEDEIRNRIEKSGLRIQQSVAKGNCLFVLAVK